MFFMTTLLGAGGTWMILEHSPHSASLITAGLMFLAALLCAALGRMLGREKGGIGVTDDGKYLVLQGKSPDDILTIPLDYPLRLFINERVEIWGKEGTQVRLFSTEFVTPQGLSILVTEHTDREEAETLLLNLRKFTGLQTHGARYAADGTDLPGQRGTTKGLVVEKKEHLVEAILRTGFNWALATPVLLMGLLSLLFGLLLTASVSETGVAGFIFGPVLAVLGVALLLLWLGKGLASERLKIGPGQASHCFLIGPVKWAHRKVEITSDAYVRVRTRAGQGFSAELVCGNSILVFGAGTARSSLLTPEALLRLCKEIANMLAKLTK